MDTALGFGEFLKEVRIDYSSDNTSVIDEVISRIRDVVNEIPDGLHITADVAPGFVRDVGADIVDFKFRKPVSMEIGGSYSIRSVAKPDVNIDLFLRLPKECFYEKDYLNHRYHAKRFLYLCIVKKYLTKSALVKDVAWLAFHNEARKPVLVVYPGTKLIDNTAFCVRIIPTATSLFTISKLNLGRSNIRAVSQATPKYNSSILEDMFIEEGNEIIRRTFVDSGELVDALILLKVWARKNLLYVHDCLNGFLITLIMAYLASNSGKHCISSSMSTLQVLRIMLDFIANSKTWDSVIIFGTEGEKSTSVKKKTQLEPFPVNMCGSFADYNMAHRMSASGFQELRSAAILALNCLDKCKDGGFIELFMTKIDYPSKYDYCIRLNLKDNHNFYALGFCLDDECWRSYELKVLSILDQAMQGRANLIRVTWRNTSTFCNFESGFSMLNAEPVFVCISIGSMEEAFKQIIMGPSPEDKDKALEFRKFWGDKATLRWFRDGRIAEVAVWEHEEWDKHLIIKEIAEHVLVRHLSLPKQNIISMVDQLDFVLHHGSKDPISLSKNLLKAYDELSKHLRLIDDIPLKISSVQPLDSAFRLTSVFPPVPNPLARRESNLVELGKPTATCIQPLEVIIQLEGSGNWPMDEIAMEKTKSAFLLKIAESLHAKWGIPCTATEDDVDVFVSGYAFQLKILHERGLSLVKKQGKNQLKRILSSDRQLFLRSQHSSMLNGLRGRYPVYGPVVRLAKRWVAAHLLSNLLAEEAIELLVAHLFLKPLPFRTPCSRISGFLRFLRLLSEYDWSFSPLIIDINGDLTPDDDKEINEKFMSNRKEYENNVLGVKPAMYLATNYDQESEAWTSQSPTAIDLKRLGAYATSTATLLSDIVMKNQVDSCYAWERLFRTPLNNYDAVVLLHRAILPNPERLLFPSEIKQGKQLMEGKATKTFQPSILLPGGEVATNKLMVGFDPVRCYIRDIQSKLGDECRIWYDSLGGDAIGITTSNKRMREEEEVLVKRVGELGKGLVRSVYVVKGNAKLRRRCSAQ